MGNWSERAEHAKRYLLHQEEFTSSESDTRGRQKVQTKITLSLYVYMLCVCVLFGIMCMCMSGIVRMLCIVCAAMCECAA